MSEYVLIRNGDFFRPDAKGYTASRAEAGLFSKEAAQDHCIRTEGVTRWKLSEVDEVAPVRTSGMAPDPQLLRDAAKARTLVEVIRNLEQAYEAVCAGRTQAVYDQMIADGQANDLLHLDNARRKAREAIST